MWNVAGLPRPDDAVAMQRADAAGDSIHRHALPHEAWNRWRSSRTWQVVAQTTQSARVAAESRLSALLRCAGHSIVIIGCAAYRGIKQNC
jgi:hypothetical protein